MPLQSQAPGHMSKHWRYYPRRLVTNCCAAAVKIYNAVLTSIRFKFIPDEPEINETCMRSP